jgi:hypothetical protein
MASSALKGNDILPPVLRRGCVKVFVSDVVNPRIVVIGFDHAAEETVEVK